MKGIRPDRGSDTALVMPTTPVGDVEAGNCRTESLPQTCPSRKSGNSSRSPLTTFSGLLRLQARMQTDRVAADALRMASIRALTMDRIYERLERHDNPRIAARDFLSPLAYDIVAGTSDGDIVLLTEMDDRLLSREQALGLGMILTELLLNAVTHAFRPGEGGLVHIGVMTEEDQGRLRLTVQDTGRGLPDASALDELRSDGMGATLMKLYADMLKGALSYDNAPQNGARVSISI